MNSVYFSYTYVWQFARCTATLVAVVVCGSCSYHFANTTFKPPAGIRSLYVEAIYDTSGRSLPHHLLWEEVQRAFAQDGRVILTADRKTADGYLRIHLQAAREAQLDYAERDADKTTVLSRESPDPPSPADVRSLTQAREFAKKAILVFDVEAEAYNLKTGERILKKKYAQSRRFIQIDTTAPDYNHGLRAREAREKAFFEISRSIATAIKRDFLSNRSKAQKVQNF